MASSSETMGSSPTPGDSPLTSTGSEQRSPVPVREWTRFELDTVCALICKHEHLISFDQEFKGRGGRRAKKGSGKPDDSGKDCTFRFAAKLNEVLHDIHGYRYDIPVPDVRELMDFIETKNALAMAYIKRQAGPFRITRSKKHAFQRLFVDFDYAFYTWTIARRERRLNPNGESDKEMSQIMRADGRYSGQNKDTYLRGTAQVRRNAEEDSTYGRRSRQVSSTPTSFSAPKGRSSQYSISRAKPAFPARRRNRRRTAAIPPPPPPPPPTTQYQQTAQQPFNSYSTAPYDTTEPGYFYHNHPDSAPPSPWYYPPPSPAFVGHEDLRQSIHPMGPRSETPRIVASPVYQYLPELAHNTYQMEQQAGSSEYSTSPVNTSSYTSAYNENYHYPEPPQGTSVDYSGIFDTPVSPSSPMYIPNTPSVNIAEVQTGMTYPVEENHYTNSDLYPQVSQSY